MFSSILILCMCFEVLMADQYGGEGMNRIKMARAPATMGNPKAKLVNSIHTYRFIEKII